MKSKRNALVEKAAGLPIDPAAPTPDLAAVLDKEMAAAGDKVITSIGPLSLRVAEVLLRAVTETPLLHGLPLYNEAEDLLAEVRAAREAHKL